MRILGEVAFDLVLMAFLGLLFAGAKHVHGGNCKGEAHGFPPAAEAAHR